MVELLRAARMVGQTESWYIDDMAGSMYEWTLDTDAGLPQYVMACDDWAQLLGTSGRRIIRGGSWKSSESCAQCYPRAPDLSTGDRKFAAADTGTSDIGLRCARQP